MTVRVRFAPSPTGQVHIGNIRAAIFNWLFARHEGGQFLLRIEDTDRERSTPQAVQAVLDAMQWLGLTFDEEPIYQSTQLAQHLAAAETLIRSGRAYRAAKGEADQGEVVFFRMPGTDVTYTDLVKGPLTKKAEDMKDFVIVRSNGTPVFHLANVVDDVTMGITHIIRGDDHVENTYRHVALFQALGAAVPQYAHLPMIVNAQGKPYSKRDGAAFVGDFRDKGYLADALFNFLALLGWSPGDDVELMTREQMIRLFELTRVKSAPARMDMDKFEWMNGEYIRALPRETFQAGFRQALTQAGLWRDELAGPHFERVAALMQERTKKYSDLPAMTAYFFADEFSFDEKAVHKRLSKPEDLQALEALQGKLAAVEPFNKATAEAALNELAAARNCPAGHLIHPLRVAVSGLQAGPGLFDILDVLGKDRVLARIAAALARFRPA
jgi:glutamyl-tRNA synthetase